MKMANNFYVQGMNFNLQMKFFSIVAINDELKIFQLICYMKKNLYHINYLLVNLTFTGVNDGCGE